jgi:hypothetical protein
MGASIAQREGCRPDAKEAVSLLEQALQILDSNEVSPDIGARLHGIIEQLRIADGEPAST